MKTALIAVLFVVGLLCLVYGCALIYRPLGWLVGGSLLITAALMMDRLQDRGPKSE